MINFDVLLQSVGYIGLAQFITLFIFTYDDGVSGTTSLATVFIAYAPDYRCNVPPIDNKTVFPSLNEDNILNLTTPYDSSAEEYSTCNRYGYNLSACNDDLSCVNKSAPVISCDNGYYYDTSLFTSTVISEFDLVCDQAYLNPLSTSMYYVGMLIGSFLFGNAADRFGRRPVLIISYLGTLGCMFGVTFSTSVVMYIVFRAGVAGFHYGTTVAGFVYLMEIHGAKWRTLVGMIYQMGFSVGYMVYGGMAYKWRNWHELSFVNAILCIPLLLFLLVLPESPRWLFTMNKDKEGIKVVERMAKLNGKKLTDEIWEEARRVGEEQQKQLLSVQSADRKYSMLDLFKTRGILIVTLFNMLIWFVNSFVYYGISLNAGSLAGDIFVNNTLNGVFEIASYVFCVLLMDRIGRRFMLSSLMLVAGVGLLASAIVNEYAGENQSLITLGVAFAFIAKFGISGSFAVIYNFSSELFPTVVRTNAISASSMVARVGGIAAPYVIAAEDVFTWLPSAIFGGFAVVAGLLAIALPETNGQPLLETIDQAEIFYKTGKVVQDSPEITQKQNLDEYELPASDAVVKGNTEGADNPGFEGDIVETKVRL